MMPSTYNEQAPVPPPSYSRAQVQAQAQRARALHVNALSLIETLHLFDLLERFRIGGVFIHRDHARCARMRRSQRFREEAFGRVTHLGED